MSERCMDCSRWYTLVWSAPHELWNAIWGDEGGMLCPDCFDARCRKSGTFVRFRAEVYDPSRMHPDSAEIVRAYRKQLGGKRGL